MQWESAFRASNVVTVHGCRRSTELWSARKGSEAHPHVVGESVGFSAAAVVAILAVLVTLFLGLLAIFGLLVILLFVLLILPVPALPLAARVAANIGGPLSQRRESGGHVTRRTCR